VTFVIRPFSLHLIVILIESFALRFFFFFFLRINGVGFLLSARSRNITTVLSYSCPGVLKSTDFYHFATGVVLVSLKQKGWHFICVKDLFKKVNPVFSTLLYNAHVLFIFQGSL